MSKRISGLLLSLLLCVAMSVGLCACGGSNALSTTKDADKASPSPSLSVSPEADANTDAEKNDSSANADGESILPESAAESQSEESSGGGAAEDPSGMSISIVVDASVAGQGIFASTVVTLPEGATVYDALCACGVSFAGSGSYVRSINGLSEFDCGPTSGWMYSVNGVTPGVSCGAYALNSGDSVYWHYVTSY